MQNESADGQLQFYRSDADALMVVPSKWVSI
jgi:hypothetical protein